MDDGQEDSDDSLESIRLSTRSKGKGKGRAKPRVVVSDIENNSDIDLEVELAKGYRVLDTTSQGVTSEY